MRCHKMIKSLLVALSLGYGTIAASVPRPDGCKFVKNVLAINSKQAPCATTYCSSLLAIKTRTATPTVSTTMSTTIQQTTAAPTVLTITAPAQTSIVVNTLTTTIVQTVIATTSTASSTTVVTTTLTSGSTTVTTNVCDPPSSKRDVQVEARGVKATKPPMWRSIADTYISAACSCLSLTTPTVTAKPAVTSTSTTTTTAIRTITSSTTTTPTIFITATSFLSVATVVTSTTTTGYVTTSTTTVTVPSNSIVPNNLCAVTATTGTFIISDPSASFCRAGDLPNLQNLPCGGGNYAFYTTVQRNGVLYLANIRDGPSYEPGSIALYVKDGIKGGQALYGNVEYVQHNGYFQPPCTFPPCRFCNPSISYLQCYNAAGHPFTAALRSSDGTLVLYTGTPDYQVGTTDVFADFTAYG
ncbi:unnamed protein product [Zymoseptoria tritici ST99CH_1A5]|uniref:PA14 domain-containing protein n=1 Tax=Zymoseptoria tritici ST99CH_1A5 TaxID=1276529 RepID=A0A1Y6LV32_ZYMTR|nr:unnamed protein product [Zymoseptoria tritici ST99CH_1A5]